MNFEQLQNQYHVSLNKYLDAIRLLLKSYSRRELIKKFPNIQQQHIRLASETTGIEYNNTLNPYCVHMLKGYDKKAKTKWLRYLEQNQVTSPKVFNTILNRDKVRPVKYVRTNQALKRQWLNNLTQTRNQNMANAKPECSTHE